MGPNAIITTGVEIAAGKPIRSIKCVKILKSQNLNFAAIKPQISQINTVNQCRCIIRIKYSSGDMPSPYNQKLC